LHTLKMICRKKKGETKKMKQIYHVRHFILLLLSAVALSACGTMSNGRPQMQSASDLQNDEIAVVGRIELVPPLTAEEQALQTGTSERFRGKAVAVFSDKLMDMNDLPMDVGNDALMAELGKNFFARMQKRSEYVYSGSFILARSTATTSGYMGRDVTIHVGHINLPGGFKYDVNPDDRAIYIGTIRYYRNSHNAITKVEHIDDYQIVNGEFLKRFGKQLKLRDVYPKKM